MEKIETSIHQSLECFGMDDPSISEEHEDYGKPLYYGVLVNPTTNETFNETKTELFVSAGEASNEVYKEWERYNSMQMKIIRDTIYSDMVKYFAVGVTKNDLFSGMVYGYQGGGEFSKDYMFEGKYLSHFNNGIHTSEEEKEDLLDCLMEDENFIRRCDNLLRTATRRDASQEGNYVINKGASLRDGNVIFKGENFASPSYCNMMFEGSDPQTYTADVLLDPKLPSTPENPSPFDRVVARILRDNDTITSAKQDFNHSPLYDATDHHTAIKIYREINDHFGTWLKVFPESEYTQEERELIANSVGIYIEAGFGSEGMPRSAKRTIDKIRENGEMDLTKVPHLAQNINHGIRDASQTLAIEDGKIVEVTRGGKTEEQIAFTKNTLEKAHASCAKEFKKHRPIQTEKKEKPNTAPRPER